MAEGIKTYEIVINGIKESISEVDKLLKKLDELDAKIIELEKKKINVEGKVEVATTNTTSTSSASSSRNTASLTEEAALQKEINKLKNEGVTLDAKIAATQDEVYQKVQATKDLYKEAIADQKQIAAQERLQADVYNTDTMAGMKAKLADIKQVMQTVDLGDTEQFTKLTQEADKLNSKLLEIEKSYGQFGRQVGNYEIVNEGLGKVVIAVGGVEREFANAREASRELSNELKSMAINGQQDTEAFKELQKAVLTLNSDIKDATVSSKAMDNLLDTMQSFAALGNISAGFSTLFGFDDSKVEEVIKKLMALQTALKGIESINQQIKSGEFLGGYLTKANSAIDEFAAKVTGAKTAQDSLNASTSASTTTTKAASVAQKELNATNTAGATTTKALTTAQNAQTVATKGTTAATKALSLALKSIGIGLVIAAITALVALWDKYVDKVKEANKAHEEALKVYAKTKAELMSYETKIKQFNGTKKEEKKLVDELNSKYGKSIGQYKTLKQWKDALAKSGEAYCKIMLKEAEVQALLNQYQEEYVKLLAAQEKAKKGDTNFFDKLFGNISDSGQFAVRKAEQSLDKLEKKIQEKTKEINEISKEYKIGDYSEQIEKGGKNSKNALEEEHKMLENLELRLMRDGLTKRLRQLDEEERQTINKLKENGNKDAAVIKRVQDYYWQLRNREINEYLKKLEESISQSAKTIKDIEFDISTAAIKNKIEELTNSFDTLSNFQARINTFFTKNELQEIKKTYKVDENKLVSAKIYSEIDDEANYAQKYDKLYDFLEEYIKGKDENLYQDIKDYREAIEKETDDSRKKVYESGLQETFKKVNEEYKKEYSTELFYAQNYEKNLLKQNQTLEDSLVFRFEAEKEYDEKIRTLLSKNIEDRGKKNEELIKQETSAATTAESERYSIQMSGLTAQYNAVKKGMSDIEKLFKVKGLEGIEAIRKTNEKQYEAYHTLFADMVELEAMMETAQKQHKEKQLLIEEEGNNKIIANTINTANEVAVEQIKGFDNQIANLRDAQSKINEVLSKQPQYNALGIINISKTKEQLNEALNATTVAMAQINQQRLNLQDKFNKGLISPEGYNAAITQLNDIESGMKQSLESIGNDLEELPVDFYASINDYVQMAGQGISQIMSSLSEITQNQYAAQIAEQEKYIDELQEMYDKQKEITQKYADDVNNIEDELKTARGDRRQQLIDNLNAEMAAQRASLAQQKKIEKEQEKAEQKKKKLEHDQAVAKKKMDLAQAFINAAMAVSMAAVNKWPVPAIPMMAMAAAVGAAQIAAVQSQNIPSYGSGGLLEGKSHKEGGIKASVGRTPIELEGQEYVIRKKSTVTNLPVLDFINRSERKLNINDFIDFYSSGKVKKSIVSASPRTKFESGGQVIPTLRTDIDINDRLIQTMEDYANRPTVVSVQEIVDVNEGLNKVKVLSGLEPSNV